MTQEFLSCDDFWHFSRSVTQHSRYIHEDKVNVFLETLYATSENRHTILKQKRGVWRAQIGCIIIDDGHEYYAEHPYEEKRMKPLPCSAHEGRVNPKGLPCLYCASDQHTAMAEVRPWVNANVSIGLFEVVRDLRLVDFSVNGGNSGIAICLDDNPTGEEKARVVWDSVDRAFSEPVNSSLDKADYVPTQIIAEFFKKKGFDGIVYKSRLGEGLNIALFNTNDVSLYGCKIFSVKSVNYVFR